MDARTITLRMMAERELNLTDKVLAKAMQKRIGAALRNARDRGLVVSAAGKSGMLVWEITTVKGQ